MRAFPNLIQRRKKIFGSKKAKKTKRPKKLKTPNLNFVVEFSVQRQEAKPGQEMPVVAGPEVAVDDFGVGSEVAPQSEAEDE